MMVKRLLVLGMIVLMLILGTSSEAKELQSSPPPDTRKSAGTSETATLKALLCRQTIMSRGLSNGASRAHTTKRARWSSHLTGCSLPVMIWITRGGFLGRRRSTMSGSHGRVRGLRLCVCVNKQGNIEGHAVLSDSSLWDIYLGAWGGKRIWGMYGWFLEWMARAMPIRPAVRHGTISDLRILLRRAHLSRQPPARGHFCCLPARSKSVQLRGCPPQTRRTGSLGLGSDRTPPKGRLRLPNASRPSTRLHALRMPHLAMTHFNPSWRPSLGIRRFNQAFTHTIIIFACLGGWGTQGFF